MWKLITFCLAAVLFTTIPVQGVAVEAVVIKKDWDKVREKIRKKKEREASRNKKNVILESEEVKAERRLRATLKALSSTDYSQVERATYKLEQMGKEAIPHLMQLVRGEDDVLTLKNSIYALGRLGRLSGEATSVIIPFLSHEDEDLRAVCVLALGKIGPGAKNAVPTLKTMLYRDSSEWVQKSTFETLKKIGTEKAMQAVEAYIKLEEKKAARQTGENG